MGWWLRQNGSKLINVNMERRQAQFWEMAVFMWDKKFYFLFLLTEQHFTEVVGSEEFLNLGMEQVSSLIASDKLTIPTEEKVQILTMEDSA